MPRFAANLSMMFTEVDFLDRFAAARNAGFEAVEFLFPYAWDAADIRQRLDDNGLQQALFNMHPGDWDGGEKGLACLPGREDEFVASVDQALEYAEVLDCPKLHVMAGLPGDVDDRSYFDRYVRHVRYAGDRAAEHGRLVVIEPLNPYSVPGYLLPSIAAGLDALDAIDHPNVKLQLDLFHAQLADGDITHLIEKSADRIGHVQLASVPDRNEPDRGELYYPFVLDVLDRVGYDGWVGCEYNPAGETVAGLGWLDAYRRDAS